MTYYILAFIFVTSTAYVTTTLSSATSIGRLFIGVFTASTIFYGILGVWYWSDLQNGTFLQVDWQPELKESVYDYILVHFLVCVTFVLFGAKYNWTKYISERDAFVESLTKTNKFDFATAILIMTAVASLYTILVGGAISASGKQMTSDPLLLIMYQISDASVGAILFKVATENNKKTWLYVATGFSMYFMYVGFRYKILLLWTPLLILWYFTTAWSRFKKNLTISITAIIGIAFMSIMTITRTKFGGMSLDGLTDIESDRLLYSLFAETNIIFGWLSAKSVFGLQVPYVGFTPFVEIFEQFIPRFLYEDKALYQHLWDVTYGLGGTLEAFLSGTAMPFFGEFYASAGYFGLITGVVSYTLIIRWMLMYMGSNARSYSTYITGASLIIVFMAYYYYSRGSIAQISKGFIFAIGPYLLLMKIQTKQLPQRNLQ